MASDLKPVYLLTGTDRPKIARAVRRLRDRFGDDSTEHLSARAATAADVIGSCNAMGLFGGGDGRLVIVDDVDAWKAPGGGGTSAGRFGRRRSCSSGRTGHGRAS